jgi:hypothetical protein
VDVIFAQIRQDAETFGAIVQRLGLGTTRDFSSEQKIAVYSEYMKLVCGMTFEHQEKDYRFELSSVKGFRFKGQIRRTGEIIVTEKKPTLNACPVCLAEDTRVDTPHGPKFIKDLTVGMMVWSLDAKGNKIAVPIISVSSAIVLPTQQIVHLVLRDGRELLASPRHPTADNRNIGELMTGSTYDGSVVDNSELIAYSGRKTYDLLPGGPTGFYWANGVLVGSTLHSTKIPAFQKVRTNVARHK